MSRKGGEWLFCTKGMSDSGGAKEDGEGKREPSKQDFRVFLRKHSCTRSQAENNVDGVGEKRGGKKKKDTIKGQEAIRSQENTERISRTKIGKRKKTFTTNEESVLRKEARNEGAGSQKVLITFIYRRSCRNPRREGAKKKGRYHIAGEQVLRGDVTRV